MNVFMIVNSFGCMSDRFEATTKPMKFQKCDLQNDVKNTDDLAKLRRLNVQTFAKKNVTVLDQL